MTFSENKIWHMHDSFSSKKLICGAKTRKGGRCKCTPEIGKMRCKFHGGLSTGPKTAEGKAKVAFAQKKRWAQWKQEAKTQSILKE
jgi:hypothetical protein